MTQESYKGITDTCSEKSLVELVFWSLKKKWTENNLNNDITCLAYNRCYLSQSTEERHYNL